MEMSETAFDDEFETYIVPHCSDALLVKVLPRLVMHGLWRSVVKVLERDVSDATLDLVVQEACEHAGDEAFLTHVVPRCSNVHLGRALRRLVERNLWKSVEAALTRGCHITSITHQGNEAQEDNNVAGDVERDANNTKDVHGANDVTGDVEREANNTKDVHGDNDVTGDVERDGNNAKDIYGANDVTGDAERDANNTKDVHGDNDVTGDAEREANSTKDVHGDNDVTGDVERDGNNAKDVHGANDVTGDAERDANNTKDVHGDNDVTGDAEREATNTKDVHGDNDVIEVAAREESVTTDAQGGDDITSDTWDIFMEASGSADDDDFKSFVLPHCPNDQLDLVLPRLVRRGLWASVGGVLERGVVSDHLRHRAIEQASERAERRVLTGHILPLCPNDQLDSVLPRLVRRCLWASVGCVLERGVVSNHLRDDIASDTWNIFIEASKSADDDDFKNYVLPHCPNDQLDSVLPRLVRRNLWASVGCVLERGVVSDHLRHRAIEQASERV
jgi:hypothetical protein